MYVIIIIIIIIWAALITEKGFQFSQDTCQITYIHYGLKCMDWSSDNFAQNVKIYIYESLLDQQYRKLWKSFIMSDHLCKYCPKVLEAQYSDFIVEVDPYC